LFKKRIALSNGEITIQWIVNYVLVSFNHWIAIYLVDSVIHLLNNRALQREKRLKISAKVVDAWGSSTVRGQIRTVTATVAKQCG